jgi:phosphate ABC transporter phosphate-binding protein
MNKTTSIMTLVALIAILTPPFVGAQQATLPTPDKFQVFNIVGAGASFPFPLIDLWRVEMKKVHNNVNINYASIGSGGGVKNHIEKTVDFAASDAPLTIDEQKLAPDTIIIPFTIGGITVSYNIPEFPNKGLKLTGQNIADIYLGKITKWNDPAIAANNPGIPLPGKDIVPVRRSDGSGTTFAFSDYLSTVSPEFNTVLGKGKSLGWTIGLGGKGNEGVTTTVKSTPYSVGYIELAYAFQNKMSYAYVQNADKTAFIEPTLESVASAADNVVSKLPSADRDWSTVTMVNQPGANSYPISSFSYMFLYEDLEKSVGNKVQAQAMLFTINWMLTDGQNFASKLLYVPLPDSVKKVGLDGLHMAKFNGEVLWPSSGLVSTPSGATTPSETTVPKMTEKTPTNGSPEIPQWIRNNAKWWGEGQISDKDFLQGIQYLIKQGFLKV